MERKQFVILCIVFFFLSVSSMHSDEEYIKRKTVSINNVSQVQEFFTDHDINAKNKKNVEKIENQKAEMKDCKDDNCVKEELGNSFCESYISQNLSTCDETFEQMFNYFELDSSKLDIFYYSLKLSQIFEVPCNLQKVDSVTDVYRLKVQNNIGFALFTNFVQKLTCEEKLDDLLKYFGILSYKSRILYECEETELEGNLATIFEQTCGMCPKSKIIGGIRRGQCGRDEQTTWFGLKVNPQSCTYNIEANSEKCSSKYFHFKLASVADRQIRKNTKTVQLGDCGCIEKSVKDCDANSENFKPFYYDYQPNIFLYEIAN